VKSFLQSTTAIIFALVIFPAVAAQPVNKLGTEDHIIHLVIGLGFFIGGIVAVLTAPEDRSLHD